MTFKQVFVNFIGVRTVGAGASHSMVLTLVGAGMLWVGWFGFNAGSELAADGTAGMAMAVTQIATATAALTWMFIEWAMHGKPSALGIASGAVAGLVAITPASGYVGPMGALAIGAASGLGCYVVAVHVKNALGFDDSLDAFGVHAIGGIIGALLTGVFADAALGGVGLGEGVTIGGQVVNQFIGVAATVVYDLVVSLILLKLVDLVIGLRVSEEEEADGRRGGIGGDSNALWHQLESRRKKTRMEEEEEG